MQIASRAFILSVIVFIYYITILIWKLQLQMERVCVTSFGLLWLLSHAAAQVASESGRIKYNVMYDHFVEHA